MGIRTKRGANIKIKGQAEKILATSPITETFALYPDDFLYLIPKLLLREGDAVKKGTPIFYSKANPDIQIVSPVGGIIESVVRGAKRKIEKIIIKASPKQESESHTFGEFDTMSNEEIKKVLLKSGAWPFLKQRPYGIVADPTLSLIHI